MVSNIGRIRSFHHIFVKYLIILNRVIDKGCACESGYGYKCFGKFVFFCYFGVLSCYIKHHKLSITRNIHTSECTPLKTSWAHKHITVWVGRIKRRETLSKQSIEHELNIYHLLFISENQQMFGV